MKKLIYIIISLAILAGCSTTKRDIVIDDKQVSNTINYDSLFERYLQIEAQRYSNRQTNLTDSVVTHVTIIRYDTIVINGEQVIKERVEISQQRISTDNTTEQDLDSIAVTSIDREEVSAKDSIQISETHLQAKHKTTKSDIISFLLFLLVVLLSYICIEQHKKK